MSNRIILTIAFAIAVVGGTAVVARTLHPVTDPTWHTVLNESLSLAPHQWQTLGASWPGGAKVRLRVSSDFTIDDGFLNALDPATSLSGSSDLNGNTDCGQWMTVSLESECVPKKGSHLFVRDQRHAADGVKSNLVHITVELLAR